MFNPTTWEAPFAIVVIAMFCIVMARANGTYWLGRAITRGATKTRFRTMLESKHYATGTRWLNRWGAPAVTLSFMTIGIQTMVNLAAGVTRMPLRRYLPAVTVGCIIWAFIYSTVGFIGFTAIARLWAISPAGVLIVGALAVAAIAFTVLRRDKVEVVAAE